MRDASFEGYVDQFLDTFLGNQGPVDDEGFVPCGRSSPSKAGLLNGEPHTDEERRRGSDREQPRMASPPGRCKDSESRH